MAFFAKLKLNYMRNEMMVEPTGISEKIRAPDGARIFSEIPVGSTIISFLMCLYHSHI